VILYEYTFSTKCYWYSAPAY